MTSGNSYIVGHMNHIKLKRTMFCRVASVILVVFLCGALVSLGLAGPGAACVPGADRSSAQSTPHVCCCGEAESCCCDVQEASTTALPDMALPPVTGTAHDLTARHITFEADVRPVLPPQVFKTAGSRTGAGPPLILSYLVNLTIRC
jgi:hypothetical protein